MPRKNEVATPATNQVLDVTSIASKEPEIAKQLVLATLQCKVTFEALHVVIDVFIESLSSLEESMKVVNLDEVVGAIVQSQHSRKVTELLPKFCKAANLKAFLSPNVISAAISMGEVDAAALDMLLDSMDVAQIGEILPEGYMSEPLAIAVRIQRRDFIQRFIEKGKFVSIRGALLAAITSRDLSVFQLIVHEAEKYSSQINRTQMVWCLNQALQKNSADIAAWIWSYLEPSIPISKELYPLINEALTHGKGVQTRIPLDWEEINRKSKMSTPLLLERESFFIPIINKESIAVMGLCIFLLGRGCFDEFKDDILLLGVNLGCLWTVETAFSRGAMHKDAIVALIMGIPDTIVAKISKAKAESGDAGFGAKSRASSTVNMSPRPSATDLTGVKHSRMTSNASSANVNERTGETDIKPGTAAGAEPNTGSNENLLTHTNSVQSIMSNDALHMDFTPPRHDFLEILGLLLVECGEVDFAFHEGADLRRMNKNGMNIPPEFDCFICDDPVSRAAFQKLTPLQAAMTRMDLPLVNYLLSNSGAFAKSPSLQGVNKNGEILSRSPSLLPLRTPTGLLRARTDKYGTQNFSVADIMRLQPAGSPHGVYNPPTLAFIVNELGRCLDLSHMKDDAETCTAMDRLLMLAAEKDWCAGASALLRLILFAQCSSNSASERLTWMPLDLAASLQVSLTKKNACVSRKLMRAQTISHVSEHIRSAISARNEAMTLTLLDLCGGGEEVENYLISLCEPHHHQNSRAQAFGADWIWTFDLVSRTIQCNKSRGHAGMTAAQILGSVGSYNNGADNNNNSAMMDVASSANEMVGASSPSFAESASDTRAFCGTHGARNGSCDGANANLGNCSDVAKAINGTSDSIILMDGGISTIGVNQFRAQCSHRDASRLGELYDRMRIRLVHYNELRHPNIKELIFPPEPIAPKMRSSTTQNQMHLHPYSTSYTGGMAGGNGGTSGGISGNTTQSAGSPATLPLMVYNMPPSAGKSRLGRGSTSNKSSSGVLSTSMPQFLYSPHLPPLDGPSDFTITSSKKRKAEEQQQQ